MTYSLSILLPTYNDVCVDLVNALHAQAATIDNLQFEIIVGDDGSTDLSAVEENRKIENLPNTRYIVSQENRGRAVIRNILARQAKYSRLLFIDSDLTVIRQDFILKYLQQPDEGVVYGGYEVCSGGEDLTNNLRYLYEISTRDSHTVEKRKQAPYRDFHTGNFLVSRNIFLNHPLDERFRHYGNEDVLWGKQLKEQNIPILHIDNPLGFCTFEDNSHFVSKTEEGLRTLHLFRDDLQDYSRLLTLVNRLDSLGLSAVARSAFQPFRRLMRRQLCGRRPSLLVFRIYQLGYYLSI